MYRGPVHLGPGVPADLGGGVTAVLGCEMQRRRAQLEKEEEREGTEYVKKVIFIIFIKENAVNMKAFSPNSAEVCIHSDFQAAAVFVTEDLELHLNKVGGDSTLQNG